MAAATAYTPREQQYYNQLFDSIDSEKLGLLTGEASFNFLLSSKLPQATLGEVWALADQNNVGYLTKDGWAVACRLIGWAQKGETVDAGLAKKAGPFPTFEGHPPPPAAPSAPGGAFMSPQTTGAGQAPPPLSPADRAQYTRIFVGCGPEGGLISGTKAQGIFLKSQLSYDKLAQIWNLADTQQRGSLDLTDFIIGMYYIQALMAGSISSLPATLPPGMYEAASGGRPRPPVAPVSPIARQMTGSPAGNAPMRQMSGPGSMLQPQRTGQGLTPGTSVQGSPARQFSTPPASAGPQQGRFGGAFPGSAMSAFGGGQAAAQPWDVSPQDKASSDGFFDTLDTSRRGYIEGDVAVPFMMQSGLDEDTLAQIWDLADIRQEGKLSRDEFAVAMHLINGKLAGRPVPSVLPTSTVPPSLRGQVGGAQQPQPSQPQRDLLDVFGDSPPATATQPGQTSFFSSPPSQTKALQPMQPQGTGASTSSFQKQPAANPATNGFGMAPFAPPPAPRNNRQASTNLMADDEDQASRSVPDNSAEVGNAQNALASTERSLTSLKGEKDQLEQSSKTSSAELHELEMRLSSVRAQHETETRLVNDLKTRTAEQKDKLKTLRDDLIRNESELSALRAEKDEIEQTLMQDKEEVRGLGKRMKEVTEETNTLKSLLEKLKKEARQQKGMVAISKKQVSTLEGGKEAVQKEMDQVAASRHDEPTEEAAASPFADRSRSPEMPAAIPAAAAIPLPATPQQMLSPDATGSSQRSRNPFDRLGARQAPSPPTSSPANTSRGLDTQEDAHSGLSQTQKGTLGVGGVITAGAIAVGSAAAAGLAGLGTAAVTAVEGLTSPKSDDQQDKDLPEATPAAAAAQETAATPEARDAADPFGAAGTSAAPAEQNQPEELAEEREIDPFGMDEPTAPPAATQQQSSGFGDGFGDSFGDSFSAGPPAAQPNGTTAAQPAAPSTFDDAFNDFDEAPRSGPVAALLEPSSGGPPTLPERTLSTQALAPTSGTHTPITELATSGAATPRGAADETDRSFESDEQPQPVTETAATAPVAAAAAHDDDSSDDEEDGPEDLDRARSPFGSSSQVLAGQPTVPAAESQHEETPTLGLGAPLGPHGEASTPSAVGEDTSTVGVYTSFPPAAPAVPIAPASPTTLRREPPPPPSSASRSPQPQPSGTNPFSSFAPAVAAALPAAGTSPAPKANAAASNFDDDDFDFENLQPVQVAPAASQSAQPQAAPAAAGARDDFDAEFDDFSPDFEMVDAPRGGNAVQHSAPGAATARESSAPFSSNSQSAGTSGFDDEDWGALGSTQQQTQAKAPAAAAVGNGSTGPSSAFSFDDAFGSDFSVPPLNAPSASQAAPQQQYAPPPGPPPPRGQPDQDGRPSLPTRPSAAVATKAQPDDLEDVKKLCGMGFDRELVISALEANDYNLQKTLNVLLPGQ